MTIPPPPGHEDAVAALMEAGTVSFGPAGVAAQLSPALLAMQTLAAVGAREHAEWVLDHAGRPTSRGHPRIATSCPERPHTAITRTGRAGPRSGRSGPGGTTLGQHRQTSWDMTLTPTCGDSP